jgi:hypothetical protein
MEYLGYKQDAPTHIAQDNMVWIYFTQGASMYLGDEHIDTRIHQVR